MILKVRERRFIGYMEHYSFKHTWFILRLFIMELASVENFGDCIWTFLKAISYCSNFFKNLLYKWLYITGLQ